MTYIRWYYAKQARQVNSAHWVQSGLYTKCRRCHISHSFQQVWLACACLCVAECMRQVSSSGSAVVTGRCTEFDRDNRGRTCITHLSELCSCARPRRTECQGWQSCSGGGGPSVMCIVLHRRTHTYNCLCTWIECSWHAGMLSIQSVYLCAWATDADGWVLRVCGILSALVHPCSRISNWWTTIMQIFCVMRMWTVFAYLPNRCLRKENANQSGAAHSLMRQWWHQRRRDLLSIGFVILEILAWMWVYF